MKELPEDEEVWPEFTYKGERWSYNEHSVARWDDELGFEFRFYHRQDNPTAESIIAHLEALEAQCPTTSTS